MALRETKTVNIRLDILGVVEALQAGLEVRTRLLKRFEGVARLVSVRQEYDRNLGALMQLVDDVLNVLEAVDEVRLAHGSRLTDAALVSGPTVRHNRVDV